MPPILLACFVINASRQRGFAGSPPPIFSGDRRLAFFKASDRLLKKGRNVLLRRYNALI
jgi:hypothetical protein